MKHFQLDCLLNHSTNNMVAIIREYTIKNRFIYVRDLVESWGVTVGMTRHWLRIKYSSLINGRGHHCHYLTWKYPGAAQTSLRWKSADCTQLIDRNYTVMYAADAGLQVFIFGDKKCDLDYQTGILLRLTITPCASDSARAAGFQRTRHLLRTK